MAHYISPVGPEGGDLPSLNRDIFQEHLRRLSIMNRDALLNTLVPHRNLPSFDPARYIIEHQNGSLNNDDIDINTGYQLGVVFGRSLMSRAVNAAHNDMPTISDFDIAKKLLVDSYLDRASHTSLQRLTRLDSTLHPKLEQAVDLFCNMCLTKVPDLMLDGEEAVRRGVHDYLSVYSLLEAHTNDQAIQFRRRLGAGAIGFAAFGLLFGRRLFRKIRTDPK